MHIVSASDDAYVAHFCAMLHSAWLYNPAAHYHFIDCGVRTDNLDLLRRFARARGIDLDIHLCGAEMTAGLPVPQGCSAATWARLLVPHFLPASVERAIYLDPDTSVTSALDSLMAIDIVGNPLAAAPDAAATAAAEKQALGIGCSDVYFNAGVLLFDLVLWRNEGISDRLLSFARTTAIELPLMDQSTINAVLRGRIHPLGREWNLLDLAEFDAVAGCNVVHYAGSPKPWASRQSPFGALYRFHRGQTPWPIADDPFSTGWFKRRRRKLGAWLGFKRYRLVEGVSLAALQQARDLLARTRARA